MVVRRAFLGVFIASLFLVPSRAATTSLMCSAAAVPVLLRSEGISERTGDIVLNCSGGQPGGTLLGNLMLFLNVPVTNQQRSDGSLDVSLTVDTGGGPQPANVPATAATGFSVVYNGLSFVVPAGQATIRISNLRGAATALGLTAVAPVQATMAFNGPSTIQVSNSPLTVGFVSRGLLANASSASVACSGSPLPPAPITIGTLFAAGTRFYSTRVTEGSGDAFQKKDVASDTGTRFIAKYSGFPAGVRLFVPDVVAGSNATRPTAGGDLGFAPSGGSYTPGNGGSLLLSRVKGANPDGSGGDPVFTPGPSGSPSISFAGVTEVALSSGSGYVVYEVMDANASMVESAQWPTFLAVDRPAGGDTVVASQTITFAPVSSQVGGNAGPVPRFVSAEPPSDCSALNDCNADYMPRLFVAGPPLAFQAFEKSASQGSYIIVNNDRGGLLSWATRVTYQQGSDWIRVDPSSGYNNATIRLAVFPEKLAAASYAATITVDGGPVAGAKDVPVKLDVVSLPSPPQPVVKAAVNAARLSDGPLVAGSLATIFGDKLAGVSLSVKFDGIPARVYYSSDTQLNVLVPQALAGKDRAQLVVTANGVDSAAFQVLLASAAPAVFANGILNQDNSVNSDAAPAQAGSVIQVFLTGLPLTSTPAVKIGSWDNLPLYYFGPVQGADGVQQINVRIPNEAQTASSTLVICASSTSDPGAACSAPAKISLKSM